MHGILIVGAGKIGSTIAELLVHSGRYEVHLADCSEAALADARQAAWSGALRLMRLDAADPQQLRSLLAGKTAVLSAVPFHLTMLVAEAAVACGVHYLDLTEDVRATRVVAAMAASARSALIPQCGLAPGFISIVAHDLVRHFDSIDTVHLRTGALPQYPTNALNYNLTWSTDGVINEYCQPCEAIVHGERVEKPALEDCEEFSLDGIRYEAFNTSGGLGSLCETLLGRVRELHYRSIRYPGHARLMKALLHDLRLSERPQLLKEILEHAVPSTFQDVVVIFVTVTGHRQDRLIQESYANTIYSQAINGRVRTAIQATTAAAICTVLDMLIDGELPSRGLVRQEQIALEKFLERPFGRLYVPRRFRPNLQSSPPALSAARVMN